MPRWSYLILFLTGLLVAAGSASLQANPGYMDAYYYYYGGTQIAGGHGWSEMFLWNYLDDPTGLPHPAFTYWMPLTSLAAAVGTRFFFGVYPGFDAAQVVFVLLTAAVAPVTAGLSYAISHRKGFAWLAGFLSIFSGFYLPFMTTTDSFSIYMFFGGLIFLLFVRLRRGRALVFGLLAGMMHLARADGLLWLGVAGLAVLFDRVPEEENLSIKRLFQEGLTVRYAQSGLLVVFGYLLVMFPWYLRNFQEYGSVFPPGTSRAMWVLSYDELFAYPAAVLTPARWYQAGIGALLQARAEALWVNLQTTFVSMGVLLPGFLAVMGFWRHRRKKIILLGLTALGVLFVMMTVVFPFSGMRGSYFHSGAAFVPLMNLRT